MVHLLVDLLLLLFKVRRERCLKSVETLLVAASSLVDVLSKLRVAGLEAFSELGLALVEVLVGTVQARVELGRALVERL